MRVLLIGGDSAAGVALQGVIARWGRHEVKQVTLATSRWKSERQAKKAVRGAGVDCVVDLRFPYLLTTGSPLPDLDVSRTHWLAKASERAEMPYLLLSSDRVFSGRLPHPYREQEAPDAAGPPGSALAEAENLARHGCSRAMILRTGPVFASSGPGLLGDILDPLTAREASELDNSDEFCPVPAGDLARVVAGILDQVDTGAEAAGIFHYASPDRTTRYGFGEAALAAASQFADVDGAAIRPAPASSEEGPRNWALDCRALRDTFAIKQQPWRGVIGDCVRAYYLQHTGA